MLQDILEALSKLGYEIDEVRIPTPTDYDIDKVYIHRSEELAYNRVKHMADKAGKDIIWAKAIPLFINDVLAITGLIEENAISHPDKINEFRTNCYRIIQDFCKYLYTQLEIMDNYKAPKSIDEMDADELREYIRKHNIK